MEPHAPISHTRCMHARDVDELLDRHRDRFRRLLLELLAAERDPDPFQVTLESFLRADDDLRAELVARAAELGRERIERELAERSARWIVIVGSDVLASSSSLDAMPSPTEVLAMGRERGLTPYLFEAPLIEELGPTSSWSRTSLGIAGDRHPTLAVAVNGRALVADLDTGAHGTLLDARLAADRDESHVWFGGVHLGQAFQWRPGSARVRVTLGGTGGEREVDAKVRWVRGWIDSPFIRINPDRVMLAGRDLLRAVGARIELRPMDAETVVGTE